MPLLEQKLFKAYAKIKNIVYRIVSLPREKQRVLRSFRFQRQQPWTRRSSKKLLNLVKLGKLPGKFRHYQ